MADFLRMNLSASFVKFWDSWLQTVMQGSRISFGDGWNDRYLSAPIWRFTLPRGHAGPKPVLGVLMPSVDRVGRQFPFTLVAEHALESTALAHFANDSTFEQLEDIALAALDDETSIASVTQSLEGLRVSLPAKAYLANRVYSGSAPLQAVLAADVLEERYGQRAVWTTKGSADNKMILCDTLPTRTDFMAMLDTADAFWQTV
jgi:type VI secretion system protein ImpM